jgi:hypothetical protein
MRNEFKFNKPKYEQQFEDLCQKILEHKVGYLQVSRYGRKGQRQHGIDILVECREISVAIQCKHYTSINSDNLRTIQKDISDFQLEFSIKRRPFRVDHFVIAISCSRDVNATKLIKKLNERSSSSDTKIPISIKFWEDIEDLLNIQNHVADWYNNRSGDYAPMRESSKVSYFRCQVMSEAKTTLSGYFHNSNIATTKHEIHIRFKDTVNNASNESETPQSKQLIHLDILPIIKTLDLLLSQVTKKFSIRANSNSIVIRTPDGRGETTVKITDINVFIDGHKELNRSKQALYRTLADQIARLRAQIGDVHAHIRSA